jgi:MFS transporter, DHA3 family, macrolide efflux protein
MSSLPWPREPSPEYFKKMRASTSWKRDTAIFLGSQAISLLGSSLVQYALMWHVTLKTQSGIMMTLYVICGFVPAFILSPFAGVIADRFDRRKIIMLSDGFIAAATLTLALCLSTRLIELESSLWLMFLVAGLRSLGSALQQPAVGAFLPQIVPEDKLVRAGGINQGIQSALMLFSPMLSGALLAAVSLQAIFYIDVVTAALAIGTLAIFLRVPPHAKAASAAQLSYFEDLKQGFRYIASHRYFLSFFAYLAVVMFLVVPAAFLTPLQVTRSFGADVWRLTAIEVVFSGGMMAGGALIAAWGGFRNRMHTMVAAHFVMAGATIALGIVPAFWPYLGFMALFGVAMPFFNTPSAVMLQERVEGDYLGRVFSVMSMISTSIMPLGMLLFGPLAEKVRIESLLLFTGSALVLLGFVALASGRLMEAGERLEPNA